ncbi:hypothetical protein [Oceanicella sp. SM1341]|uniref:hypothetical protein n=1 Tax=Oceanicella sp. SM1341 TaxID=1548889 RepID=UPI0013006085|nr:hypothetical protein [Oceanicella sp. SM1341]
MTTDSADPKTETGKAAVRRIVIDRLNAAGFQRPTGCAVEAHRAELERVVGRLAYLEPGELEVLAEALLEMGEGKGGDRWPREVRIANQARAIRQPPPGFSGKVVRFMRCEVGRQALAEGWAGPLLTYLQKRPGVPSGDYVVGQLREQARDQRRRVQVIEERAAAGMRLASDDEQYLRGWRRREQEARALVQGDIEEER